MGKYTKKKPAASGRKSKGILIGGIAAVAVIALALILFLPGKTPDVQETLPQEAQEQTLQTQPASGEDNATVPEQTESSRLELTVESVEQEEQTMVITTSYCVLKYPFAFSDLIRVTAVEQDGLPALLFHAYLNGAEYPIFSIVFDGAEGIPVGTLELSDGTTVSVTAQLYEADGSLAQEMLGSFYAAQENFNDIISSLNDAEGFTPAQ